MSTSETGFSASTPLLLAGGRETPVVKLTGVGTLLVQRDEKNMNHTAKAGGWRKSTHAFIVRPSTRLVLNLLLILDILVVLAMFVLEVQYLETQIVELKSAYLSLNVSECSSDHTSSCPNTLCTASAGGNGTTANSTDTGAGTYNMLDCTFKKLGSTELEFSIEVLSWTSMAVLTIFMAENILHIFTLGCQFFKNPFLVFDVVIVSVGFGLEVYDKYGSMQGTANHGVDEDELALGLVIFARCWRFLQFGHSMYTEADSRHKRARGVTGSTHDVTGSTHDGTAGTGKGGRISTFSDM